MTNSTLVGGRCSRTSALVVFAAWSFISRPASATPVEECVRASDEGQELRDKGQFTRAMELFAECTQAECPSVVRSDCATWLLDLKARLPSLVFAVRDRSGRDRVDVRVTVDGQLAAERIDGRPLPVDPGEHVIVFSTSDHFTTEQRVVVRSGEKDRTVVATLAGGSRDSTEPSPVSHKFPFPSVVVGSLALAFIGAGIGVGLSARADMNGIEASPCAATRTCSQADVDAVRSKLLVSDGLIGVGLAGAATALALYFLLPH